MFTRASTQLSHFACAAQPSLNFTVNCSPRTRRRFRHVAVRCILATDLARSAEFTAPFEQELTNVPEAALEQEIKRQGAMWTKSSDELKKRRSSDEKPQLLGFATDTTRLLLASMIVKVSDVSHAARRWDVHIEWTARIQMEFAAQGLRLNRGGKGARC